MTTSQVLHPERYRAGDAGQEVVLELLDEHLPAGWTVGPPGTLGELLLRTWVEEIDGRSSAARSAAAGWDGDAVRVVQDGAEPRAFVARIAWATRDDAAQFLDVARTGLSTHANYQPIACPMCGFPAWSGKQGVIALLDPTPVAGWPVLLAVAPTIEELRQLVGAVR